jgi:ketosteroid isomerase-like protein
MPKQGADADASGGGDVLGGGGGAAGGEDVFGDGEQAGSIAARVGTRLLDNRSLHSVSLMRSHHSELYRVTCHFRRSSQAMPASPREVFEHQRHAMEAHAWTELTDLYAEDVVVDLPFNLPEPLRLQGREQLRARFLAAERLPFQMTMHNLVVHETSDPEVIVAEFDYHGRMIDSGREFSAANVIIMRVRAGQIVSSRDYHNHALLLQVFGDLPELTTARSS